jgi:uncharacterized protein (DUF302 family)
MEDVTTGWFEAELDLPMDAAIEEVTGALKKEGFGILTRIDLDEAFREKLGVDFRRYAILGACNPSLAHLAVGTAPEIGLFLPCNITVEDMGGGRSLVRLTDPEAMLAGAAGAGTAELDEVAADARARIERVAADLAEPRD